MGEISLPTAADYAWASANDANRKNEQLEQRLERLESKYEQLLGFCNQLRVALIELSVGNG